VSDQARVRYALWAVFAATLAVRVGFGAVLPGLPLYAQQHGLSTAMIAVMTNAYLLTHAVFQSYAGHLGDRWGRRPVMLAGTWLYTAAAGLFMLDMAPWFYILLRALEGLGACFFGPSARAYVADLVPEGERGRAYGMLTAFDMAGFTLGPMLGSAAIGLGGPKAPFALCAVLALLAAVPLLLLTRSGRRADKAVETPDNAPQPILAISTARFLRAPAFWAVAMPQIGLSYLNALYSVIWSLHMQRIGASNFQISLSWTTFAIPMVLFTVPFGRLADRVGRPLLVGVGGLGSTLATISYALLPYPNALIGFGVLDGVAAAMFSPASQAYMADVAPPGIRGKFMGLVGAVQTVATILCVTMVGWMYDRVDPFWLFVIGAIALLVSCSSAVAIMVRRPAAEMRRALEGV
jgi:DHA1 family multidrug resistance protein-like MFS transporter